MVVAIVVVAIVVVVVVIIAIMSVKMYAYLYNTVCRSNFFKYLKKLFAGKILETVLYYKTDIVLFTVFMRHVS